MNILKIILLYFFVIIICTFSVTNVFSQSPGFRQQDTLEVAGNWRGSSVCQVKGSACHDEIVVYNILRGDGNIYHVAMNKVVKGKVDFMSLIDFTYEEATRTLSASDMGRIWQFTMKKNSLDGMLIWHNQLYRKLHLERE
jgi:hypothetical protein